MRERLHRRRFVEATGAACVLALAGCTDFGGEDDDEEEEGDESGEEENGEDEEGGGGY